MKQFVVLKWLRVAVSLLFFLLIFFLFIDFTNSFSGAFVNGMLFFQFIPSLIKFINLAGILTAGFIVVLILTLFFGRIYCSTFCPLGTLQDIVAHISQKIKRRKFYKYSKPHDWLRYFFLAITIVFVFSGSLLYVNLLDPFSAFGKIISNLIRPVYYGANNLAVFVLEKTNLYTLYPVKLKSYNWISSCFSALLFVLILRLTIKRGRFYCNSVCPVGTCLGLVSGLSLYKIRLDESSCTSCGICGANCKSGCIDSKNKKVDFSRCVGCLNCLTVCPGNGVKFSLSYLERYRIEKTPEINDGNNRRQFLLNSASISIGLLSIASDSFSQDIKGKKIPIIKKYPVTPPGSVSIAHFHNNCTACHLCISACPTHVLQPSIVEYGWDGLFQPRMDYKASFCNFECILCSEICPTGAILPIALEKKKLTQLGKTNFVKENCVVYTDETACGACSEHCPTKAVNMIFYKGKLKIPEVTQEICIGCGACEYACPTTPKSIYVEGNPVHLEAQKPKEIKSETEVKPEDDFPF